MKSSELTSRGSCCSLTAQLVISANSTSLAPWHAKLGFLITTSTPVASLESLVSDGGLIAPSLDVVVEKVFPYGYVDLGKGGNRGIWNEEEERTRADDWEVRCEHVAKRAGARNC